MKISKFILFFLLITAVGSCSKEDSNEEGGNPSSFNLLFVSNNAINISFTPTFTWEVSTDPNGASVTYEIYLQKADEVPSGSLPTQLYESGLTTNTYTATEPLLASTQYIWYVQAKSSGGGSTNSSSVFSFITGAIINQAPNQFFLNLPLDNEIDVPTNTLLEWETAQDPENDPVVYDVYLNVNDPDIRIGVNIQGTSLPVGSLLPNTTYAWFVQAKDDKGNVRNSTTFTFTTEAASSGSSNFTLLNNSAIPNEDGRSGHQTVNYNGKIWIIGGAVRKSDGTGGEYNDVWNSDDSGTTWSMVKDNTPEIGFTRSDEHQAVVFRNEIWVLNGNRNTTHKSSDGATWENVPFAGSVSGGTHYEPRNEHQAVVFNDRLYIVGGNAGGILKNDVWSTDGIPDPNNDNKITWIKETDNAGFEPRIGHQVVVFNNKLYLTAGSIQGGVRMNDVWSSPDGVFWTEDVAVAPFTIRTQHAMFIETNDSAMWLLCGDGINPDTGNTIVSLNDAWFTVNGRDWIEYSAHNSDDSPADSFKGRKEFDIVVTNELVIIIMGKYGSVLLGDIWNLILE